MDITINQLETQSFLQVPKIFMSRTEKVKGDGGDIIGKARYTSPYAKMSNDAKLGYASLYERCRLSMKSYQEGKRDFVDENGSVFLLFTIQDLMEVLNLSKGSVIKVKKELTNKGLLREVRQGVNKPNRLYLQLVESKHQIVEHLDLDGNLIETKPYFDREVFLAFQKSQEVVGILIDSGSSNFGLPKIELQEVQKLNPTKNELTKNEINIISSRKAEQNSDEFSQPTGAGKPPSQSVDYVQPQFYSLLQPIAQAYNDRVFGYPDWWKMTHQQKMLIGQYLEEGYILSHEVIGMIAEIPNDSQSPFAYLVRCLDNLKEERRLEAKLHAHRTAEAHHSQKKGDIKFG